MRELFWFLPCRRGLMGSRSTSGSGLDGDLRRLRACRGSFCLRHGGSHPRRVSRRWGGMFLGVTPLTDVALWARGQGLGILVLLTGGVLLTRLASWLGWEDTDPI